MADRPSSILSAFEKKVLTVFADALIPPTERIPQKPSDLNLIPDIEDALFYSSGTMRNSFRLGLRLLELRAFFFRFSGKRFTRMNEALRSDYLQTWFHSSHLVRRNLIRLMETYVLTNYYARPEISSALGYRLKLPNKTSSKALYGDNVRVSLEKDETIEVDVCIVGSGAGGAPMAAEMADAGLNVVILEEGGRFDLSDFNVDAVERSKRMYRDAGITATTGIPPIVIPLGRTIGGTTTINSGTCFRTPASVFEKWQKKFGLSELTPEFMGPYYERAEKTVNVREVPEELLGGSARVIKRGMEKMGLKGVPLKRNVKACEGSGLCCFGCPTDAKQSVQLNYIPEALKKGAKLYAHCRVEKFVKQSGRIEEVRARFVHPVTRKKGCRLTVKAKVFVLSAGTIHTPVLLKGSGLGKRSGQLGKNLTLHPTGKALGLFEEEIRGWEGVPQSYSCADFTDQGIMFEGAFTPPSVAAPAFLVQGLEHKRVMENFSHLANFGFLVTDESRGRVVRKPNGEAMVFYSIGKEDLKKIVDGIVLLCRMFFEAGAKEVYVPIHPFPKINSPEEISELYALNLRPKDLDLLAFHPLGTCRMGVSPKNSVIDPNCKLHEMENLYVVDGSIFPSSLGVNPQMTIMAFSHRAAEHILKTHF